MRDGEPVPIDAPVMKQAIAWEFVLRNVRRTERKLAEETLKLESGADDVSEVKVSFCACCMTLTSAQLQQSG